MPVDTSIYNLIGGGARPKSLTERMTEYDQADAARAQLAQQKLSLIGAQQEYDDSQQLRKLYAQPGFDPLAADSLPKIYAISPKAGATAQKGALDARKAQADIEHVNAQTAQAKAAGAMSEFDLAGKRLSLAMQIVTTARDPAGAHAQFQEAVRQKLMTPEEAAAKEQEVPTDPDGFQKWREDSALALMKAGDRLELARKQAKDAEDARHNRAQEGLTARGQNMLDARSRAESAQPTVVQGDQGPLLVNRRTGQSQPVIGPDGQPVGPRLKDVPQTVVSAYVNNNAALKKIDDAIAAVKANPSAFGLKNYLGDTVMQRADAQGVRPRAIVSDIGSLKIHDRTGAAMSVGEAQRLKPFIPGATDDAATILTKLENLRNEYVDKNGGMEGYYGGDMGFKPLPKTPSRGDAAGPAGLPSADAIAAELARRAKGGR